MNSIARIAIVGSGPAGMYALEHLLHNQQTSVEVDIFERLPVPWGLVRYGVAPDHPEKKLIANRLFNPLITHEKVRFFGNVEIGNDISHDELSQWYNGVIYASGATSDNRMNIPGEDLSGSWSAREFVAWYNGHPDYQHLQFDFSSERAVIVGNGNVALDVARILLLPISELQKTDIASYAIEALRHSRIREVVILGRRGFHTGAYNNPELEELLHIEDLQVSVEDPYFSEAIVTQYDWETRRKIKTLQQLVAKSVGQNGKRIVFKFLTSPVEILGDSQVQQLKVVNNDANGQGAVSTLDTSLIFRAIGYRGQAFEGLPFDSERYVIENINGRISDQGKIIKGAYVTGWIKRGPRGVIGTNKQCSAETVTCLLEDLQGEGAPLMMPLSKSELLSKIKSKKSNFVTVDDWLKIDRAEKEKGFIQKRPREKFTNIDQMLAAAHC